MCAAVGLGAVALTCDKEVTARDRVRARATAAVAADMCAVDPREQRSALRADRTGRGGPAQDLRAKGSEGGPPTALPKLAA